MIRIGLLNNQTVEEEAISFIQEFCPPDGWVVGFSGGKDSIVLLDLVRRAGVPHLATYSATGIDPPEVCRFIRKYYPDVLWCHPKKSFFAYIQDKGYPTRWVRWCCDKLKKDPTKHLPRHRLVGVRAEESAARAKRKRIEMTKHPVKQFIYKPIFHWLSWEIWDYIERRGLPYCELYDQGFDRIGCVICPLICRENTRDVDRHRERWPKQYRAFEKAMTKLWVSRVAAKGFDQTPEELIDNWYHGFAGDRQPDVLPLFEQVGL